MVLGETLVSTIGFSRIAALEVIHAVNGRTKPTRRIIRISATSTACAGPSTSLATSCAKAAQAVNVRWLARFAVPGLASGIVRRQCLEIAGERQARRIKPQLAAIRQHLPLYEGSGAAVVGAFFFEVSGIWTP